MSNRLAEAFVELGVRDTGVVTSLNGIQTATLQTLETINNAWLRSVRLREDASATLAQKLQNINLRPIESTQESRDAALAQKVNDLDAMRRATQLLANEERQLSAFREAQAAGAALSATTQRIADLSAMRRATQLLLNEEQQLNTFRQHESASAAQKTADLNAMRAATQALTAEDNRLRTAMMQRDAVQRHMRAPGLAPNVLGPTLPVNELDAGARAMHVNARGAGRLHFALLQASFGVQDFVTMYGPAGLGGALRASVNNWAQVAAIISPLTGAFAGLAVTLGSVLVTNLIESGKHAQKTASNVDGLTDAFRRLQNTREGLSKLREAGLDARDRAGSTTGSAEQAIHREERRITELAARQQRLDADTQKRRENLERGVLTATPLKITEDQRKMLLGIARPEGPEDDVMTMMAQRKILEARLFERAGADPNLSRIRVDGTTVFIETIKKAEDAEKALREEIKKGDEESRGIGVELVAAEKELSRLRELRTEAAARETVELVKQLSAIGSMRGQILALEKVRDDDVKKSMGLGISPFSPLGGVMGGLAGRQFEEGMRKIRESVRKETMDMSRAIRDDISPGMSRRNRLNDELEERLIKIKELRREGKINRQEEINMTEQATAARTAQIAELERDERRSRSQMVRGLRDDVDRGFAPIGKIFDELEDRQLRIKEMSRAGMISPDQELMMMREADRAKDKQLEELRKSTRKPASFVDIAGLGNAIQMSLMTNAQDQAVRDTAKYTRMSAEQLAQINAKKTEPLITD